MTEHPETLLSAYLDDALDAADRAGLAAHLDGCGLCRARLADLAATSRLIRALPTLEPRRSLVPRMDRAPVWLRPVRLLGAMASGLFVFLFIASAVLNSGSSLGGGTTTAEQLAAKGQFGAAIDALASDNAKRVANATAVPATVPAPAAQAGPSADAISRNATAPTASTPGARAEAASTAAAAGSTSSEPGRRPFGPPPQLFLSLAALCALGAFVAHRRLRRS